MSAAVLLGGCPANEQPLEFQLLVVEGGADCSSTGWRTTPLRQGEYTLRLTFLRRSSTVGPDSLEDLELVCDRSFSPNAETEFHIPLSGGRLLDLRVEAFDSSGQLRYSGLAQNITVTPNAPAPAVLLYPTLAQATAAGGGSTCIGRARRFRAFHSATLLPNGEVILIGGLTADPGDREALDLTSATAFIGSQVEIFSPERDPLAGKDTPPSPTFSLAGGSVPPRSFHQAVLLPSLRSGPYRVLLLGGIQPPGGDAQQPAFALKVRTQLPFLITPLAGAEAAEAGIVTYYPPGLSSAEATPRVEYQALADLPRGLFPALALGGQEVAILAGGLDYQDPGPPRGFSATGPAVWVNLPADPQAVPAMASEASLTQVRAGHALARLGTTGYLVLGGTMTSGDLAQVAQRNNAPSFAPAAFEVPGGGSPPAATAWHTLSPLGSSDWDLASSPQTPSEVLLWAGGYPLVFETDYLQAAENRPQSQALWLIGGPATGDSLRLEPVDMAAAGHFRSVGYHQATRLSDGSVLLSGGSSPLLDCPSANDLFCASEQLVTYTIEGGRPLLRSELSGSLVVSRFGHRATRLLDKTVLITGGITLDRQTAAVQLVGAAEILNPATGSAAEDYPLGRDPAKDTAGSQGGATSTAPAQCAAASP